MAQIMDKFLRDISMLLSMVTIFSEVLAMINLLYYITQHMVQTMEHLYK